MFIVVQDVKTAPAMPIAAGKRISDISAPVATRENRVSVAAS